MISGLAGERRFASTIAKRLESLGALTHGDRRATEKRDFSQFNFENKYGTEALKIVLESIEQRKVHGSIPLPTEKDKSTYVLLTEMKKGLYGVNVLERKKKKHTTTVPTFLNRLLGIDVRIQNLLFKYFTNALNHVILMAKSNGTYDLGILGNY